VPQSEGRRPTRAGPRAKEDHQNLGADIAPARGTKQRHRKDHYHREDVARLKKACFYKGEVTGNGDDEMEKPFTDWTMVDNFENKLRNDRMMWETVYRYQEPKH